MQTPRRALVVSIHDVSPLTEQARICNDSATLLPPGWTDIALLVIPNHHGKAPIRENPEFCDWLRESAADARGCAAWILSHAVRRGQADGGTPWLRSTILPGRGVLRPFRSDATLRLERGKREFVGTWLVRARFHRAGLASWSRRPSAQSRRVGFEYTTTLRTFKDLVTGRETVSHSLVWSVRSAWRRVASLGWNRLLAGKLFRAPLLRIGLHPVDWQDGAVRRQALHWCAARLPLAKRSPMRNGSRVCVPSDEFSEV